MGSNKQRFGFPLALAAVAVMSGAASPGIAETAPSAPTPDRTIQLDLGRGQLVNLPSAMSDLFVADDKIADVSVRSPTQLYVFAKGAGETNVYATNKAGHVVFSATVRVGQNINSIASMLDLAMPDAKIQATTMNGLVLLTGTVANPDDAAQATSLVQAFVGDGTKVVTRLKTATPLQVNLQVKFAEVSRSFIKNIGVNLAATDTSNGFRFGASQGAGVGSIRAGALAGNAYQTLGAAGHLLGLDILGTLELGETTGQVSVLNTTNLSALSGETGSFLAGGEIPIPVNSGLGATAITYKPYGVSLAYTPTVLSDGRISLRVRPEVSQLSSSNAITVGGVQVPSLTTRRAETTVDLGSGQSFMIAGLMTNNHQNQLRKAPGLGDIPILGALFRSNEFQRNESELVIVITPYLVKPTDSAHISLPTDGYRAPTDAAQLFLGQMESGRSGATRPMPHMAPQGPAESSLGASAPLPSGPHLPRRDRTTAATPPATLPKGKPGKSAAPGFSNR